jgi:ion channel-forming bestrophin family protein
MAEEMAAPSAGAPPAATDHEFSSHQEGPMPVQMNNTSRRSTLSKSYLDVNVRGTTTPHSVNRHSHLSPEIGIEDYFVRSPNRHKSGVSGNWLSIEANEREQVGPRDMDAHSKLPYFLRMHGSVMPRMILPLFFVGGWATCITCISKFVKPRSSSLVFPIPNIPADPSSDCQSGSAYNSRFCGWFGAVI